MNGRRIESPFAPGGALIDEWPRPGDYYHDPRVGWSGCTPTGDIANLSAHHVIEHDDGTITVSPSILVSGGPRCSRWHGFLERGVWRAA